jgi:DNA-binding PadR family transcriptional regulator
MKRGSRTPFVVLGILGIVKKPLSGYDIKQIIDGTISHFWSESYGQIYPVLKRLAAEKLIRARVVKKDRRNRIVYTLTAKGRKRLGSWMELPPRPGPQRDELILKLFFGSMTETPVLIQHLTVYRDRLKAMHDQYAGWLKQAEGQNEGYTPYQVITLKGGIVMSKCFVQWADESLKTLRQMKAAK